MKQAIRTNKAPRTDSLLSQGILAGDFLFTGGFIHTMPDGTLVEGSVTDKAHQIMKNLKAVLNEAGFDFTDVVKATIYVTDIADLPLLNEVWVTYFSQPLPAREGVCVKALPLGASIEISMVAWKES